MSINSELKKVCKLTDLTVAEILEICECEMEDFVDMDSGDIVRCLEDNGWEHPELSAYAEGFYDREMYMAML
jgi:hypothetical protein